MSLLKVKVRDKNTNSQTNNSIKYISETYEDVMQNKFYYNQITKYVFQITNIYDV